MVARSPGTASVLSLIIPGVGQFYNGDFLRGLFWLVVTPGLWIGSGGTLGWICHVIAAMPAYHRATIKNRVLRVVGFLFPRDEGSRRPNSLRIVSSTGSIAAIASPGLRRPSGSNCSIRPVPGGADPRSIGVRGGAADDRSPPVEIAIGSPVAFLDCVPDIRAGWNTV